MQFCVVVFCLLCVCMYVCVCVCMYVCVCVCMYVCVYVCMYVHMYVCMYVFVCCDVLFLFTLLSSSCSFMISIYKLDIWLFSLNNFYTFDFSCPKHENDNFIEIYIVLYCLVLSFFILFIVAS